MSTLTIVHQGAARSRARKAWEGLRSRSKVLFVAQAPKRGGDQEAKAVFFLSQVYVNTMNLLFNMVLPFATMLSMNYLIYRAMNRPQRSRNRRHRQDGLNRHHRSTTVPGPGQHQQEAIR